MLADTLSTARERIIKPFPERQFIHRTGGQVNYFVLSTKAQLWLSGIGIAILLWSLVALFSLLWVQSPFYSSTQELRVQKEEFNRHLVDLDAQVSGAQELLTLQQSEFEKAAASFEQKHNTIVAMLTDGGIAKSNDHTDAPLYAQSDILMSPVAIDSIARQPRISLGKREAMQTGTILDASLVNLEQDQNKILSEGEVNIQSRIEKNRAILTATGIPFGNILKNAKNGVGGPFIGLGKNKKDKNKSDEISASFLPRLSHIQARAAEVKALDAAMLSVPLAFPIDAEHYLTSTYGIRKDPFTKRPTKHSGMDYASYRLAPIVATANGKISFVGRRSGYGRVVEIAHGHGFKTRYAHLDKTYVKRGQTVEKGEKIAGMGSTGRSTSTHLHYEVHFENRVQNPALFLKAGQYVQ